MWNETSIYSVHIVQDKIKQANKLKEQEIIAGIKRTILKGCKNQAEVIAGTSSHTGYSLLAVEKVLKANIGILWRFETGTGIMHRARFYSLIK